MFVQANALHIPLAAESVHSVVTSPPYFGLRDYGVAGQIGLEESVTAYVAVMVDVGREIRRVLRSDGTFWLNLGDAYANPSKFGGASGGKNTSSRDGGCNRERHDYGLPDKSLIGLPWRVALALQADGWVLRSEIIWNKSNAMPESVTDRPARAHEHVFLLSKQPRYYYDHVAIRERAVSGDPASPRGSRAAAISSTGQNSGRRDKQGESGLRRYTGFNGRYFSKPPLQSRNRRSVWTMPTGGFPGSHFATFPPDLVKPMVLAGTSHHGVCPNCGAQYERNVEREVVPQDEGLMRYQTVGWMPTCECAAGDPVPATVLDPFVGTGTVVQVARELRRRGVGIDLSHQYLTEFAQARCAVLQPVLMEV